MLARPFPHSIKARRAHSILTRFALLSAASSLLFSAGCRRKNPMPTAVDEAAPTILPVPMSDKMPVPRAADDTKDDTKPDDAKPDKNDKATPAQALKIDITADKAQYGRGDLVTFSIVARNTGDRVQSLSFSSGQNFDVVATRETKSEAKETDKPKPAWRWSDGKMFTMNFRTVSFKPGETRTFGATWEQKLSEGTPAARGRYQIIGELATVPRLASAPLVIELVN